jgi:two-component system response regulator NreC
VDPATIKVLIVDKDNLFAELISRALSNEHGLEVVGVAHEGDSAIRLAREMEPDIVLMDIELSGEHNGIEAGKQIQQERPQTGIVILSNHSSVQYMGSVSNLGWSYLLKQSVPDVKTVVQTIQWNNQGMVVLDRAAINSMHPPEGSLSTKLSLRQQDVLSMVAQGYSNAEIAQRLALSTRSVESYISTIYEVLNLERDSSFHPRVRAVLHYLRGTPTSPTPLSSPDQHEGSESTPTR